MKHLITGVCATLISLVGFGTIAFAQSASAPVTQPDDTVISPRDRAFIASKMYASIPIYFAHSQTIPDFDLEASYQKFLDAAFKAPGRYEFDLACMEFMAQLHNGHSGFSDPWLYQKHGTPLGFSVMHVENQWVVTGSRLSGLDKGDILETLDEKTIEEVFQENKKYLQVSSDWAARTEFFRQVFLFPERFNLTIQGGKKVVIIRTPTPATPTSSAPVTPVGEGPKTTGKWISENRIAYVEIPSFDNPRFEQGALELVNQYKNAETLIVDLRGNGGGNTPVRLIDALMDRPYRGASTATPIGVALWRVRADYFDQISKDPKTPRDSDYGYLETMKDLSRDAMFFQPSPLQKPEKPVFTGKLIVLINRNVGSAAEDFCIPFKDNHRATIVGEPSYGSTGQPYYYSFPNGMSFRVSSKRDSFPDGSPFEGVGIVPDVAVVRTIDAVRSGEDMVLKKALEIAERDKKQ
ncbi:MAG: hypothetical protein H7145_14165 [Akkermansiaceae bacterium]|nr:hypothetical protein [Armatimonadota bacterium]